VKTPGQGSAGSLDSANANLHWGQLQPPGALIRYLTRDWPAQKRAELKKLLEVDATGFSKLVVGAFPISVQQATSLAKMTAVGETIFLKMEQNFSRWWETLSQKESRPDLGTPENAGDILFSAAEISRRVASLALEMTALVDKEVTLIAVLKGAFIFSADLTRFLYGLKIDAALGFVELKAYAANRASRQDVEILTDVDAESVRDKTVLIVDDVYDTGRTLECAVSLVKERGAREVLTCALVDKLSSADHGRKRMALDYVGFRVKEDGWLVGYGMDDKGGLRGARDILVRPA
jgi:hypoxanthine phosphoribosyltransferase